MIGAPSAATCAVKFQVLLAAYLRANLSAPAGSSAFQVVTPADDFEKSLPRIEVVANEGEQEDLTGVWRVPFTVTVLTNAEIDGDNAPENSPAVHSDWARTVQALIVKNSRHESATYSATTQTYTGKSQPVLWVQPNLLDYANKPENPAPDTRPVTGFHLYDIEEPTEAPEAPDDSRAVETILAFEAICYNADWQAAP